jgi:hypothetical protein
LKFYKMDISILNEMIKERIDKLEKAEKKWVIYSEIEQIAKLLMENAKYEKENFFKKGK